MVRRFEAELARQLAPVAAPAELWERVQCGGGGRPPGRFQARWRLWAAAAAAAVLALLFSLSLRSGSAGYLERRAVQELALGTDRMDLRSGDPAQIRAWIKARTGLDLPIPAEAAPGVQLAGVSMISAGPPIACVTYRSGNRTAKLLITKGVSAPRHRAMDRGVYPDAAVSSWSMEGQTYALASLTPQDARAACILCHVDGRVIRTTL